MNRYRKLILYIVGVFAFAANRAWGFDIDEDAQAAIVEAVIAILTGIGVWGASNEQLRPPSSRRTSSQKTKSEV